MDELAREYHDTHDPEIPEEIYELARRLSIVFTHKDRDSDSSRSESREARFSRGRDSRFFLY